MRHRKAGKKLGRTPSHRLAMFNNLLVSFLEHEHVRTTDTKAKELKRLADRMITLGKKGTLAARRQAAKRIHQPAVLQKLFDELAPRFRERPGGYSRITKIGPRKGDAAPVSLIELIPADEKVTRRPRHSAPAADAAPVTTKESFANPDLAGAESGGAKPAETPADAEPASLAEPKTATADGDAATGGASGAPTA